MSSTSGNKQFVSSLYKALQILKCFSKKESELSLAEISTLTGINKSSVHRLLDTLEREKFIRSLGNGRYTVAIKTFEIGSVALKAMGLGSDLEPFMDKLTEETQETCHVTILSEGEILYVNKKDGPMLIRMVSELGIRAPVHCTAMGNVLLAFLPKEEVEEILAKKGLTGYTPTTITNKDELMAKLETVRRNGYAIHDGEYNEGVCCVAAPIRNNKGEVIAAMSVSGPSYRLRAKGLNFYIELVIKYADLFSAFLGWDGFMEKSNLR